MKRILSSAFIILLTISAAQAQTASKDIDKDQTKEQKIGANKLNLTADQKTKLEALRAEHKKSSEAVRNNASLDETAKESRLKEVHQQFKKDWDAILTPEQRAQQDKMKETIKSRKKGDHTKWHKGAKGRSAKGDVNGMERRKEAQQELGLTTEQQQKMTSIRSSYKPKLEAIRKDTALTEEQKRTKMRALIEEQQKEMKAVLTADQIEKMEAQRGQYSKRKNK